MSDTKNMSSSMEMDEAAANGNSPASVGLFGRLTVGQKILSIVALCITFVLLTGSIGYFSLAKIGGKIEQIVESDLPVVEALSNVSLHQLEEAILFERGLLLVSLSRTDQLGAVVEALDAKKAQVSTEILETQSLVESALAHSDTEVAQAEFRKIQSELATIKKHHTSYSTKISALLNGYVGGFSDANSIPQEVVHEIEEEQARLVHEVEGILAEINRFTIEAGHEAEALEKFAIQAIVAMTLIAAAICFVLAFLMARQTVVRPLETIVQALDALASGDVNATVTVNSRDEIGKLGEAFRRFRQT